MVTFYLLRYDFSPKYVNFAFKWTEFSPFLDNFLLYIWWNGGIDQAVYASDHTIFIHLQAILYYIIKLYLHFIIKYGNSLIILNMIFLQVCKF